MPVVLTCRLHPKYMAVMAPRNTSKHPDGCPGCNLIWGAVFGSGKVVYVIRRTVP